MARFTGSICMLVLAFAGFCMGQAAMFDISYLTEDLECAPVTSGRCFNCSYYSFMCTTDTVVECTQFQSYDCQDDHGDEWSPYDMQCSLLAKSTWVPCLVAFTQVSTFSFNVSSANALTVRAEISSPNGVSWTQTATEAKATGNVTALTFTTSSSSVQYLQDNADGTFSTTAGNCTVDATCQVGDISFSGSYFPYTDAAPFSGGYTLGINFNQMPVSFATTEAIVFQTDEDNLYFDYAALSAIPTFSVEDTSAYTLTGMDLTNLYSVNPFFQYDFTVSGSTHSGQMAICDSDNNDIFGATPIYCKLPKMH